MIRLEMKKLQYDINSEAANISALSSGKIDKYEYLNGEETLPSNQQQIIEQAKFFYSPFGKAFEKQIMTIEDRGKKQVEALKCLKPKEHKAIKDKFNNQSKATIIFNDLLHKRKSKMSAEYNNSKLEYLGPTKDVSFYEYKTFYVKNFLINYKIFVLVLVMRKRIQGEFLK